MPPFCVLYLRLPFDIGCNQREYGGCLERKYSGRNRNDCSYYSCGNRRCDVYIKRQQNRPICLLGKEKFETEYGVSGMVKERKAQYKDLHTKHNIAGACLCVTALIPLFAGAIIDADNDLFLTIMLSLSFLIAGVGVICFIKTGIIWASYEKLLQEGEYSKENKEKPSFSGAIYTAYWVIATAVYLGYSLSSNNWGQSWIIWVVAGVIFPAVIAITNAFEKKSK